MPFTCISSCVQREFRAKANLQDQYRMSYNRLSCWGCGRGMRDSENLAQVGSPFIVIR
jgi:hypothetical protein